MSDQHQTHALTTSSIPPLLGVLAIALLRHWRFVAHEETERWLAVIDRLLAAYRHAPDAFAYTVHRLSTADGYRHWSARYDHGANPLILAEQPVLAELIARRGVGTALDAACGTGRVSALLAAAGHAVTGIDASEAMLAKAVAKVPGAVFRSGDLTALPFADDAFDLVTCCLALTHCIDLAVPIAELARAAAPGATILLSDIHPTTRFLVAMPGSRTSTIRSRLLRTSTTHSATISELSKPLGCAFANASTRRLPRLRPTCLPASTWPTKTGFAPNWSRI